LFRMLMVLMLLLSSMTPAGAVVVRGNKHGLTAAQLRSLRQLPARAILPGRLPAGYALKVVQTTAGPKPTYQIDYRCFCGGMNYTISILGTTQPLLAKTAGKFETLSAKTLGTSLKLGLYPAGQGFKQPFYMSSWLGKGAFRIGVISALQGHSAPRADLIFFLQNLEYLP
jgi:hypothetical protein